MNNRKNLVIKNARAKDDDPGNKDIETLTPIR